MSEDKVRIGLLGAGSINTYRHAAELAVNPAAELVIVYDPIKSRAKALAERSGIPKIAASEKDVIENPDVDAVVIGTPNCEHARLTIAALEAGKHVLCEKPMATNLEDAALMIAAAKKAGRKLMIGHNQCLMPPHIRAKKLLKEGIIGDVLTYRTAFCHGGPEMWSQDKGNHTWFFKKEKAYVGSMGDLGVHKAYLIPWLLGTDFDEVASFVATMDKKDENGKPITVDDNAVCIMKMKNGVMGQLTSSWTNYGPEDNKTVINGTKGTMVLGNSDYNVEVYLRNGEQIKYKVGAMATNEVQVGSGVSELFVNCILDDVEPPFDGLKGYKALATVVACLEACKTGTYQKVCNELVECKCSKAAPKAKKTATRKK